jgi:hypothetical protein
MRKIEAPRAAALDKAYRTDFEMFRVWCETRRISAKGPVFRPIVCFAVSNGDQNALRGLRDVADIQRSQLAAPHCAGKAKQQ